MIAGLGQLGHLAHHQLEKALKVSAMTGRASLGKTQQEVLGSKHVSSDTGLMAAGIRPESQSVDEKARLA